MQSVAKPITEVKVKLVGEDGNAFNILARVSNALKRAGYSDDFIRDYQQQAMSGSYENLLAVTMQYVEVE